MYLVGAPHPHKSDTRRLLEKAVSERQSLVTDAEVLQEILHRYVAIDRPIAERAKQIVLGYRQLSARDAVHIAVMEHHGIEQIMTFDSGF